MILYHYTSNENFISLIQEKKLHLSSLNLSNDTQEGMYFFDQLKDILFNKLGCSDQGDYEYHLQNFCKNEGAVGFCFSEESDLLSQWRAYANDGAGVNIGFKKERLEELIHDNSDVYKGLYLTKAIYSDSIDKEFYLEKIECLVKAHELNFQNIDEMPVSELLRGVQQSADIGCSDFSSFINEVSPFRFQFKNPSFAEEKEWRLFRHILNIACLTDLDEIDFKSTNNLIIPYMEFPSLDLPSDIIREVVLGPKNNTPDDIIEMILLKYKFFDVEIKHSQTPYR